MKQYCKWIAALFTVASATAAFAWSGSCSYGPFGASSCGYSNYQLAPVGERVIYRQSCPGNACSYGYSEATPGQVLGNVISAPFRLVGGALSWTGRTLSGQPAVVAGSDFEPVGERLVTVRTYRQQRILQPVGERYTVIRHRTILQPVGERFVSSSCLPVGERFTTVRVIRHHRVLQPVGERFTTVRVIRQQPMLQPVGERFTTVRVIRQQPMLTPIGERFTTTRVIHHRAFLQPVGERFTTQKVYRHSKMLSPIGERCTKLTTTKVIKHHGKNVMLHKVSYKCGQLQPIGERTIIRSQKVLLPVGERAWNYSNLNCGCR